jgi:hypothetical protein
MWKQTICLLVLVGLLSGPVFSKDPAELAHWRLDNNTDDSAGDNQGTLMGGPVFVTDAMVGSHAVALDAGQQQYVDFGDPPNFPAGTAPRTMCGWAMSDSVAGGWRWMVAYGSAGTGLAYFLGMNGTAYYGGGYGDDISVAGFWEVGVWHHLALTYDGSTAVLYADGVEVNSAAKTWNTTLGRCHIGRQVNDAPEFWDGLVDDVHVYNRILTQGEIVKVMLGVSEIASNPVPASGAVDVPRDVTLGWGPGEMAVTHDVYFGTSLADVENADSTGAVGPGQDANTYDPADLLEFGTTYFWRVDEVNGAPDNAVFKGNVWSFTAEPFSYPITAITATASSSHGANLGPEKTIDGSGLNALDQHSGTGTDMWLSGMGDANPSIQFEFDREYKLDQLWVWNSNQLIEAFVGLGAKDVQIETSTNNTDWTPLDNISRFAQAPGAPDATHGTVVDFGGVMARSVRITINSGWGPMPQYGLSEVRFFYIPTYAREPIPVSGAVTDDVNVVLTWRPGRGAAGHEVYLGTEPDALILINTVTENRIDLSTRDLQYGTTYYWRINEVNSTADPASYEGDVWSFSTPTSFIVDGFDQYNDNCERIFFKWLDGIGHNGSEDCDVAAYDGNGSGSMVGNASAPFAERAISISGSSLPLFYDNSTGMSEATLELNSQDWSAGGIQSLSLFFHGALDNTGQLYLKINNAKVPYSGDAADIARPIWQPWLVDLSTVGGNLSNVTQLTIGIEGAGDGTLYIDEIRLYPQPVELMTPAEPDAASLVAHYALDGNGQDSSGNGYHGVDNGNLTYAAGMVGQALVLDGVGNVIDIENSAGWPAGLSPRSMCAWGMTSSVESGWRWMAAYGSPSAGQAMFIGINITDLYGGGYADDIMIPNFWTPDEWYHIGLTYDGATARLYVAGVEVANAAKNWNLVLNRAHIGRQVNDAVEFWYGLADEVRIYNTALSPAEMSWLAGRADPMFKPFE